MTDGDTQQETSRELPLSPCVLLCTLDENQQCLGCRRTLAEIRAWSVMSADEQWAVLDNLAARTPVNEATIEDSGGD